MHDIRTIRDNPGAFDAGLARRGIAAMAQAVLAIDSARRLAIHAAETATAEANLLSKQAGEAKQRGDATTFEQLRQTVAAKKAWVAENEALAKDEDKRLNDVLLTIPNLPYDDVPDGKDETGNRPIHYYGSKPNFSFTVRQHFDIAVFPTATSGISGIIGDKLAGGLETALGAKLSGNRFAVMYGAIATVHRALGQFMIDVHVNEHELKEVWTPVIVNSDALIGTGQLPKFKDDLFELTNGGWLIPTAEVTLTNIVAGTAPDEEVFPLRYVAHTQCFRSEAGSAGRDVRGMLRQHQFEKVEMVSITTPDKSEAEHKRMTECAQNILEKLGLAYRTMVLCTGDMGAGARRTHDLEVWLPGQNTYREISSVSTCGDYQARRMNARFKPRAGGKPEFVHTLNGSGLAVGRTLIAVLENGQTEDGSVTLPAVLWPYLGGKTMISGQGALV